MKNYFKSIFSNVAKGVSTFVPEPTIEQLIKANSICSPMNKLEKSIEKDGIAYYWLNPNNQKCFNFGWFSREDFIDWTNGTGKIVKGNTEEEKKKFWDVAVFEKKYDMAWAFGYHKKDFHLIDETYRTKQKHNYSCNTTNESPLKITKNTPAEIENLSWISDICIYKAAYLYYVNNGVEMPDFEFVYKNQYN
jgi:hypothetical protein